jgi:valyl-tRNA synthetase
MNLDGFDPAGVDLDDPQLSDADRWILTRLGETVEQVTQALEDYRFNEAAGTLYSFTWNSFCDWYIELSKEALHGGDAAAQRRVQGVLFTVLEQLLRLLHPFMPFITEEIWQALPGTRPAASLMLAAWPAAAAVPRDPEASARMELVMEVIRAIRNVRGEMDVPPGKQIAALLLCGSDASVAILDGAKGAVKTLARVGELQIGRELVRPAQAATQVAGDVEICLPLAGLVDIAEEEQRLGKEIAKVRTDVEFFRKKLSNEKFVANAPVEVLAKDRGKLAEAEEKLAILERSLAKLRELG